MFSCLVIAISGPTFDGQFKARLARREKVASAGEGRGRAGKLEDACRIAAHHEMK